LKYCATVRFQLVNRGTLGPCQTSDKIVLLCHATIYSTTMLTIDNCQFSIGKQSPNKHGFQWHRRRQIISSALLIALTLYIRGVRWMSERIRKKLTSIRVDHSSATEREIDEQQWFFSV